jgi:hypothetical protein
MTVVNFPKTQAVLSARQRAGELEQYISVATGIAERALRSTMKARKLETCLFRFCRFLGAYNALASTMELNVKILLTAAEEEGHNVAAQRIEYRLERAFYDARGSQAFQALPNDAKTREGIRETILSILFHLDDVGSFIKEIQGVEE